MTSNGEIECRRVLEEIFGVEFPSCRPDFMKNPTTRQNLEIDCYNHSLRIALEYHGEQHYRYPNHFHKSESEFLYQVKKDRFKRKLLPMNNIYYIEVPYTINLEDIEEFIKKKLKKYFEWIENTHGRV